MPVASDCALLSDRIGVVGSLLRNDLLTAGPSRKTSLVSKKLKNIGVISFLTVISRLLALVRDQLGAAIFGASALNGRARAESSDHCQGIPAAIGSRAELARIETANTRIQIQRGSSSHAYARRLLQHLADAARCRRIILRRIENAARGCRA